MPGNTGTTKKDRYVRESKDHPDLWDSKPPKTESASISRKHKVVENEDDEPSNYSSHNNDDNSSEGLDSASCSKQSRTKQRKKRMTSFELSELIVRKGMKSRTELLAYANEQKLTGKSDIAEFIVNRGPRVVSEVLATAWEMTNAQAKLDRSKKTRTEILEEAAQGQCASGCNGEWLTCASEVLEQNGIRREAFATAIRELLEKGRSKFRNTQQIPGKHFC